MRSKINYQETFSYDSSNSVKVVRDYVDKYKRIDEILQENQEILDLVHEDFESGCLARRKGEMGITPAIRYFARC